MKTAVESDAILARCVDRRAPRYTSYPTADRFVESFGQASYRSWAACRNTGGIDRRLALYVHLPFCRDVCYYCACNRIVTRNRAKTAEYLRYLHKEITLQAQLFRSDPQVNQMHWGGGTPTYYDCATLRDLYRRIAGEFDLARDGDYSIEVDPRTVDGAALDELRRIGFNRVSFGVQDFDPGVQAAIHRPQSFDQTHAAIAGARRAGFRSINLDLVYGLPRQTLATFEETVSKVVEERPDRVALYHYAHLPAMFPQQRGVRNEDLPSAETRAELSALAAQRLAAAEYLPVGMDHFALPGDALAVAQRQGRLRRGFQGYSAEEDCDLVGLGVSAIGAIGPTYSQNCRELKGYYAWLDRDCLPIMRGIELGFDDLLRRAVIQSLMCRFEARKSALEMAYLVDFDRYFAAELAELRPFATAGLIAMDDESLTVTPTGRAAVRAICVVFDRYLRQPGGGQGYSRVI